MSSALLQIKPFPETPAPTIRDLSSGHAKGNGSGQDEKESTAETSDLGYHTRPELLSQILRSRFYVSGYGSLWRIGCHVQECLGTLSGTVPSYYLKQLAQTIVLNTAGVGGIENRLRVEKRHHSA